MYKKKHSENADTSKLETFIIRQGHFHSYHKMDVMLLSIASKYEVVSFNRIWDMDNCLEKT